MMTKYKYLVKFPDETVEMFWSKRPDIKYVLAFFRNIKSELKSIHVLEQLSHLSKFEIKRINKYKKKLADMYESGVRDYWGIGQHTKTYRYNSLAPALAELAKRSNMCCMMSDNLKVLDVLLVCETKVVE